MNPVDYDQVRKMILENELDESDLHYEIDSEEAEEELHAYEFEELSSHDDQDFNPEENE